MTALATIQISDLSLRAIIGTNAWEREKKQDILIHIILVYDATRPAKTDDLKDAVDYKKLTKDIIRFVESSRFFLIEKLTDQILDLVMGNREILKATVRVEKPQALRYAKTVSLEMTRERKGIKRSRRNDLAPRP